MFRARDVMTTTLVSVRPQTTVEQACELMLRHHVSGMPVVDENGVLAGVVSEFDLLKLIYNPETEKNRVADYMTVGVVSVSPTDSVIDVADLFLERSLRRLPVVEDGKLLGMISRRDLIRFVLTLRHRMALLRLHRENTTDVRKPVSPSARGLATVEMSSPLVS